MPGKANPKFQSVSNVIPFTPRRSASVKLRTETLQQYLARGGKITVLPARVYVPAPRIPVFPMKVKNEAA